MFVQICLLKVVGLLPFSGKKLSKKVLFLRPFFLAIAVCFFLGILYSCGFSGAFFLYGLFNPTAESNGTTRPDPILEVLQLLPFFTINVRAFFVLLVFFLKQNSWKKLMKNVEEFLQICFSCFRSRNSILEKMKKISAIFFLVTFSLHVVWEYSEWVVFIEGLSKNFSMTESGDVAAPLPMKFFLFQYIILWTLFSTFPFILSQQVYICIIILAIVLGEAIKKLNFQILEELKYYDKRKNDLTTIGDKELELTEKKVDLWEFHHIQILIFCDKVNHYFSLILFIIYGMDFLTLLGFTSNLIKNSRSDIDSYAYLVGSSFIFVMYGTIFLIPLVQVHEWSSHWNFTLYQLKFAVKQMLTKPEKTSTKGVLSVQAVLVGNRLVERLQQFEMSCRAHTCMFNALELIHYSRGFLVGTCTLLLSFMVLAREFFAKEQAARESELAVAH